jgi:hypothetical protein
MFNIIIIIFYALLVDLNDFKISVNNLENEFKKNNLFNKFCAFVF